MGAHCSPRSTLPIFPGAFPQETGSPEMRYLFVSTHSGRKTAGALLLEVLYRRISVMKSAFHTIENEFDAEVDLRGIIGVDIERRYPFEVGVVVTFLLGKHGSQKV